MGFFAPAPLPRYGMLPPGPRYAAYGGLPPLRGGVRKGRNNRRRRGPKEPPQPQQQEQQDLDRPGKRGCDQPQHGAPQRVAAPPPIMPARSPLPSWCSDTPGSVPPAPYNSNSYLTEGGEWRAGLWCVAQCECLPCLALLLFAKPASFGNMCSHRAGRITPGQQTPSLLGYHTMTPNPHGTMWKNSCQLDRSMLERAKESGVDVFGNNESALLSVGLVPRGLTAEEEDELLAADFTDEEGAAAGNRHAADIAHTDARELKRQLAQQVRCIASSALCYTKPASCAGMSFCLRALRL